MNAIHEMRFSTVVITILISLICILIALLQYYYVSYKRLISVKYDVPTFEDMIPIDKESDHVIGYLQLDWDRALLDEIKSVINSYFDTETGTSKAHHAITDSDRGADSEAYNSVQAALSFKLAGKIMKARKLFEHAVAVAPNNPDVLNRYGEFLEQMHKDVVTADELYSRVSKVIGIAAVLQRYYFRH